MNLTAVLGPILIFFIIFAAKLSTRVPDIDQPPIVLDEEDELSPEEAQMVG